ncbi:MAG: mechanosensitive ion channel family protein [Ruaniaceae bacterium]|nr:mechanosensitive ion channel family protein [Ruaniaceae bacterium]
MDETAEVAYDILTLLLWTGAGAIIGLLVSIAVTVITGISARRHPRFQLFARSVRFAQRLLLVVFGAGVGLLASTSQFVSAGEEPAWRGVFEQAFVIALIVLGANLLIAALKGAEASALDRYQEDSSSPHARRVRTQMQMIRRVGVAVVVICAVGGILFTFPQFTEIGAALFTSAGVLSIVAGLAAQSSLGNLFAGIQIAFTDAVRVDDVVSVEGQFGTIEELTLTYVVVRTWDDRRVLVPSTYFTTNSFENWTRREAQLLGTVFFDLDIMAPVKAMRVELQRIVESSDVWDGRTAGLQITDATGGRIEVRAVVSAASSGQLWDLRCEVREQLVEWIQNEAPYAMVRTRLEPETTPAPPEEERVSFIEETEREWEEQKDRAEAERTDTIDEMLAVDSSTPAREPISARQAREAAAKRDRKAAKKNPSKLADHGPLPALPSSDVTQLIPVSELERLTERDRPAAESHLYSGSPEADARGQRLSGPSRVAMAEREAAARRREQQTAQARAGDHVHESDRDGDSTHVEVPVVQKTKETKDEH